MIDEKLIRYWFLERFHFILKISELNVFVSIIIVTNQAKEHCQLEVNILALLILILKKCWMNLTAEVFFAEKRAFIQKK